MAIQIVPLSPETWPALAALFDEGCDPKRCSCMYWRLRSSEMSVFLNTNFRCGDTRTALASWGTRISEVTAP